MSDQRPWYVRWLSAGSRGFLRFADALMAYKIVEIVAIFIFAVPAVLTVAAGALTVATVVVLGLVGLFVGKLGVDFSDAFGFPGSHIARRTFHRLFNPMLLAAGWRIDDTEYEDQIKMIETPAQRNTALRNQIRQLQTELQAILIINSKNEKRSQEHEKTLHEMTPKVEELNTLVQTLTAQRNKLLELLGKIEGAVADGVDPEIRDTLAAADFLEKLNATSNLTIEVPVDDAGRIVPKEGEHPAVPVLAAFYTALGVPVAVKWFTTYPPTELGLYTVHMDLPLFGKVEFKLWVVPKGVKELASESNESLAT